MSKNEKINEQLSLKQQALDYEKQLSEQKERIFCLVDENNKLKELNAVYQRNEEKINAALILAVEKADDYKEAAKLRYDVEVERIKAFYNKWLNYLNKVRKLIPEDKKLIAAEKLIKDMDTLVFSADESLKKEEFLINDKIDKEIENQYKAEKERLEEISKNELQNKYKESYDENAATLAIKPEKKIMLTPKEFAKIIERLKERFEPKNGGEYLIDLNEVLNPKDLPDIDVLCSELGLG